jgi:hypothetical protein
MNEEYRYSIFCNICDEEVTLTQLADDEFVCNDCGTRYYSENGVIDNVIAHDMYALYRGAKRAGLIKTKDNDYV